MRGRSIMMKPGRKFDQWADFLENIEDNRTLTSLLGLIMKKIPTFGMCYFSQVYDFERFSQELKHAIKSLDIHNVRIDQYTDGSAIVIHEWAKSDDDLSLSHMVTKKIVERFGGEYVVDNI